MLVSEMLGVEEMEEEEEKEKQSIWRSMLLLKGTMGKNIGKSKRMDIQTDMHILVLWIPMKPQIAPIKSICPWPIWPYLGHIGQQTDILIGRNLWLQEYPENHDLWRLDFKIISPALNKFMQDFFSTPYIIIQQHNCYHQNDSDGEWQTVTDSDKQWQTVTDSDRQWQTVTDSGREWQTVTDSQTVTNSHIQSQTVTDSHRQSQTVTDSHSSNI